MKSPQIKQWLGISLTKKRAYYLLVLGIIGYGFSMALLFYALEFLLATPNIYDYDVSIYYKVLLLGFSNLVISLGFMGICGSALHKVRQYRKFLRINRG